MLKIEEIDRLIKIDKNSKQKRIARIGQKYYEAEHDILNYRIFYYNSNSELVEDTTRSNIKISHPFFTELVDQEVQFALSKFSIKAKKETDKILDEELQDRFDDDFKTELANTTEGAVIKGWDFMYGYLAKDNKTRYKNADSLGVIEVRANEVDDKTEHMIYYYIDRIDEKRNPIMKIEVWDKDFRYFYIKVGITGQIQLDKNEKINPRPHKVYKKDDELVYKPSEPGYGFIPFFRLDNNKKRFSGLKPIKKLIDDYDLMNCGLSNNLQDVADAIYVVRGFKGSNLDELHQNIRTKKMIGTSADGGIDIKTIDVPYEARKTKMEIDEKNIYKFGMGFNASQIGDGNITNIIIKSRYTLLDLKCNKLEKYLRSFLKSMIQIALDEINEEHGTNYTMKDAEICLEREIPTNEADNAEIEKTKAETKQIEVNIILDAASKLDDETIVQELCNILDVDYEKVKDKIGIDKIDLERASQALEAKTQVDVTTLKKIRGVNSE